MSGAQTGKEVFGDAIELPEGERDEFVRRACGGDAGLLAEVRGLLGAHATAPGFLRQPTLGPAGAGLVTEGPGTVIGRYRLVERLGEGGFGVVFVAEQREPVARRVAIKVVKPGMDTARVIARFEAERQALAVMDHPNIAKVLDAGTTDSGRPYFVMELVGGRPITEYCDEHRLSIPDRLGLFMQVCSAVQHAHVKGVIHRDLNPRNILVGEPDGRARVIDFGIAKAIDRAPAEQSAFTEQGQIIGTPEYMSPEQAQGSHDIDTRTDVYSLGVLLYELLTGSTPFDPRRLRSAAFDELRRIIREDEPPRPSTRLSASGPALAGVAAHRGVDAARLGTIVRGELDWIVLKALEKDRARRYDSPGMLAADVERYLTGSAVAAAPPSGWYRFRKSLRRHRVGVAAGAVVMGALLVGLGAALWQAGIAARERDAARLSAEAAVAATERARLHQKETEQIAEFQSSLLRDIDAKEVGESLRADLLKEAGAAGPGVDAAKLEDSLAPLNFTNLALRTIDRAIFSRAVGAARERFPEQPLVRARLLQSLAGVLREVGLVEQAAQPQAEALRIRREALGDDHPDTVESIGEAGLLMRGRGRFAEAEALMSEALERSRRVMGERAERTLTMMNNLAAVLAARARYAEAEPLFRAVVEERRAAGSAGEAALGALNNLAYVLREQGKHAEADPVAREAIAQSERVLGVDHPTTIVAVNTLASILWSQQRLDEAEPLFRVALERARGRLGDDHPTTVTMIYNRGALLRDRGDREGAAACFREVIERFERVHGGEHPDTLVARRTLGLLYLEEQRWTDAEELLRAAARGNARLLGAVRPETVSARCELARALIGGGRFVEAEQELLETESALRAGAQERPYRFTVEQLVSLYEQWDRAEPGMGRGKRALVWRERLGH